MQSPLQNLLKKQEQEIIEVIFHSSPEMMARNKEVLLLTIDQLLAVPKELPRTQKYVYSRTIDSLSRGRKYRGGPIIGPTKIEFVFHILMWSEREISLLWDFGQKSMSLLKATLEKHGLHIGMLAHLRMVFLQQTA